MCSSVFWDESGDDHFLGACVMVVTVDEVLS